MPHPLISLVVLAACGAPPAEDTGTRVDADGDRWFADEDCDDENPDVNPGIPEIPYNGLDDDCDPASPDDDLDGDGWIAAEDCDDTDPDSVPVEETCNGLDDDCDGAVDEDATDLSPWWPDADGDGWGTGDPVDACDPPAGHAAEDGDCDDADPDVHPGAEEVCNDLDDDCDGVPDDGLADAEGWADLDGDGYGDPYAPVEGCDAAGAADNSKDCDDTDPDTHPGAVERQDGHDDDCDGVVDEGVVMMVIGYQCQAWGDEMWVEEKAVVEQYLTDMALGWDEVDEDGSTSSDEAAIVGYDVALFCKCGRFWESYNQDMVDAFLDARARGTATLFFDDDIASGLATVTNGEDLVRLVAAPDNGSYGTTATVDATSTHPAYLGAWGTPTGFLYNWDMDRTTTLSSAETVLGTHSGSYPWWVVWEGASGVRSGAIVGSLYTCNEGPVGATATTQLEIVFKNTLAWLLRM